MTQIDCYDQAQDNVIITPEKYQEFIITPDQLVPDSIASYCWNLFKRDLNKLHHRIKRQGRLKPKQRIQLVELIKLPVLHSQLKEHGRFATPIFFNTHSRHATKPEGHVIGNGRMLVSSCYAPDTLYDFVHYTKDYGDRSVIERMVHELGKRQERKDYSLVNCLVDEENDVYYTNTIEFYSDGKEHVCGEDGGSWLKEIEVQLQSVGDQILELVSVMPRTSEEEYRQILDAIISLPYDFNSIVLDT